MPVKEFLTGCQPVPLYVVLILSTGYFVLQLVLCYVTHALTQLLASYHMLCNILALAGCILTMKHIKQKPAEKPKPKPSLENGIKENKVAVVLSLGGTEEQQLELRESREEKLRNTFGWARIDILTMLIVFIILAALSFSLIVEALQTLVHIDHEHEHTMHWPLAMMILGFVGLILNGLTYLLIGGYTLHQGSFLHLTPGGNVVLDRSISSHSDLALKPMDRTLSKSRNDRELRQELESELGKVFLTNKRQGAVDMLRDVSSTLFVIVCGAIVYVAEDELHTAKIVDPVLSIFSCVLLVSLSYPYMKESCLILLQTIPGSINLEIFESTLVSKFPEIVSYHDLHIWQLAAHSYVATIHIQFQNPKLYLKIIEQVRAYFYEQGITAVTIQPEFYPATNKNASASLECLMQCQADECIEKVCCRDSRTDLREASQSPIVSREKTKSCLELSSVVVNKPAELNVSQLLKKQKEVQKINATPQPESPLSASLPVLSAATNGKCC